MTDTNHLKVYVLSQRQVLLLMRDFLLSETKRQGVTASCIMVVPLISRDNVAWHKIRAMSVTRKMEIK